MSHSEPEIAHKPRAADKPGKPLNSLLSTLSTLYVWTFTDYGLWYKVLEILQIFYIQCNKYCANIADLLRGGMSRAISQEIRAGLATVLGPDSSVQYLGKTIAIPTVAFKSLV